MDFNTGRGSGDPSRRPDDSLAPLFGSESTGPPRPPSGPTPGGTDSEFDLSDPVGSFVRTVREIVLNPIAFFRGLPRQGGFVNPLLFAVVCSAIAAVLGGLLGIILAAVGLSAQTVGASIVGLFTGMILLPIVAVAGSFIGAGIYHLLVLLLVKPNAGFEGTYRVAAYSFVVQLVSWLSPIPLLGILISLVVGLFAIVLNVLGIREIHATTTGRAALVVLIPVAVLFLLALLLGTAFVLLLRSAGIS